MRLAFIAAALASAIALCEGSTKMVIGYFPNWLYANYPVENIPYTKYTHINYAFAVLNNEDNVPSFPDDWAVEAYLPKVVQMAHEKKTKVLLSVGGWTGSKRFSPMVASAESRKKFIDWNLNFIQKYETDGVDLDWEYPGKQAAGCNEFADDDADNFLLLLKELREALDASYPDDHKEISMAVHVQPFVKSGVPMSDLKAFVPYFDHVNLMTYDINGAWASTTGPNAPFESREGHGAPLSFVDSIRDWKAAGVPANKITAGLAFYGRSMKAKSDMTVSRSQFQEIEAGAPKGDSDDAFWSDPYCNKEPGGVSGIWKWTNLRKEGLLKDDFVTPGEGWQRNWDEVSQTPWLFNPETKNFISYDDPKSLNIKVEHALCEDLAGVMVWDIHQDNGELLDVVNRIHNPVPATCAKQVGGAKVLEFSEDTKDGSPEKVNDEVEDVDDETVEDDDDEDDDTEEEEEEEDEYATSSISEVAATTDSQVIPSSSATVLVTSSAVAAPTATSSSAADSDPSSDASSEEIRDNDPCSVSGEQKCVSSGKSGKWLTCNIDKWLIRDCAKDLVCHDGTAGTALYCGFPEGNNLKAQSASPSLVQKEESSVLASFYPEATAVSSVNELPDETWSSVLTLQEEEGKVALAVEVAQPI